MSTSTLLGDGEAHDDSDDDYDSVRGSSVAKHLRAKLDFQPLTESILENKTQNATASCDTDEDNLDQGPMRSSQSESLSAQDLLLQQQGGMIAKVYDSPTTLQTYGALEAETKTK